VAGSEETKGSASQGGDRGKKKGGAACDGVEQEACEDALPLQGEKATVIGEKRKRVAAEGEPSGIVNEWGNWVAVGRVDWDRKRENGENQGQKNEKCVRHKGRA